MSLLEKHLAEAEAVGLELIGPAVVNGSRFRTYKFDSCGHYKEIRLVYVKKNSFRCTICLDLKLKNEAKVVGLELMGPAVVNNVNYRAYKCSSCDSTKEIKIINVRQNNFRCTICLDLKFKIEAEAVGLELMGPAVDNNVSYRLYKFNSCGHTKEIETACVRRNNFRCAICLDLKFKIEAEAVGLELMGPAVVNGLNYKTYKFNLCGHTKELRTTEVRSNLFKCALCLDLKLKNEAESVGLELMGLAVVNGPSHRTYKFNSCKHRKEIRTASVRRNSFRCTICLDLKLKNEAKVVGLELLGPAVVNGSGFRTYKFESCGHTKVIQPNTVRSNYFQCQQCEITSRTQPSTLYLLKITALGQSWLKLGYAKNLNARISAYGLPEHATVEILKQKMVKTGNRAHEIELTIHKWFSRVNLNIVQHHKNSGGTECYPVILQNSLIKTIGEAHIPSS